MGFGCDDGLGSYDGVDGVDGRHKGALTWKPLVPMMVASMVGVDGGFEWWRR